MVFIMISEKWNVFGFENPQKEGFKIIVTYSTEQFVQIWRELLSLSNTDKRKYHSEWASEVASCTFVSPF